MKNVGALGATLVLMAGSARGQLVGSVGPAPSYSVDLCGSEEACSITEFDGRTSASFDYDESTGPVEVGGVTYAAVVADPLTVQLSQMHLIPVPAPAGELDCGAITAVFSNRATGFKAEVALHNVVGEKTCRVDWDGVFAAPRDYLSGDALVVYYLLGDITGDAQDDFVTKCFVYADTETSIVTQGQAAAANFKVDAFFAAAAGPEDEGDFQTVLRLSPGSFVDCGFPSRVRFVFGGCTKNVAGASIVEDHWSYTLIMSQEEMDECATSATTINGNVVYAVSTMADFTLPNSCDEARPKLPTGQDSISYNVNSQGGVDDSQNGDLTQLMVEVEDYTAIPCDNRIVPMAKVQVVVRARSPKVSAAEESRIWFDGQAKLDGIALVRQPELTVCTDDTGTGGDFWCLDTFVTEECIRMDNTAGEGDAAGTCEFTHLGYLDIEAEFHSDSSVDNAVLEQNVLPVKVFEGDECALPAVQEDVSADFPMTVSVDGASLDDEVTVSVAFDTLDNSAKVTVRILNVLVSIDGGAFAHTFDVEEKVALMQRSTTPYYDDAHFCRYEEADGVCGIFYDFESGVRWNDYCTANAGRFQGLHRGYRGCMRVDSRAEDRFAFTPSNWVFNQFAGTATTMTVRVIATVDTCTTETRRRRLSGRSPASAGRALQEGGALQVPVQVVATDIIVPIATTSDKDSGVTGQGTGSGNGVGNVGAPGAVGGDEPTNVVVIALSSACGLLFVALLAVAAVHRRREQAAKETTAPKGGAPTADSYHPPSIAAVHARDQASI